MDAEIQAVTLPRHGDGTLSTVADLVGRVQRTSPLPFASSCVRITVSRSSLIYIVNGFVAEVIVRFMGIMEVSLFLGIILKHLYDHAKIEI